MPEVSQQPSETPGHVDSAPGTPLAAADAARTSEASEQRLPPRDPSLFTRPAQQQATKDDDADSEPAARPARRRAPARKSAPARGRGRPVNPDSDRRQRTYRERLRDAQNGQDIADANEWARANGVPIETSARLAEEAYKARKAEEAAQQQAAAPAGASQGAQAAPGAQQAAAAPPAPPPPPDLINGQPAERVKALAQDALPLAGLIVALASKCGVDVSKPVKARLFSGTKHAGEYETDAVGRMAELAGTVAAKRVGSDGAGPVPAEIELAMLVGGLALPALPALSNHFGGALSAGAGHLANAARWVVGLVRRPRR